MAYKHGVYVTEQATSVLPPVQVDSAIPFIVGTAPVGMTDETNVNKPVLCYSYAEAVAAFGYVPPKKNETSGLSEYEYTISEFLYSQFVLYGVAPVIVVNVLDPKKHKKEATTSSVTLDTKTGAATIAETGIIPSTVSIESYVRGTDYELTFDVDGNLVVTSLTNADGEFLCTVGSAVNFTAEKCAPELVDDADIVGGVDVSGNKSGFELVSECFPRFRMVPGSLLAPGFSYDPTVAAVMVAKSEGINGHFRAFPLIDAPADIPYSEVAAWKNNNNVVGEHPVGWPLLSLDGVVFHVSTQLAGLLGQVDGDNDGVPHVSPSNKNFQMTAAVMRDGKEVFLGSEDAAYLNGQGIVTALNFIGGWKCWGNRNACYPAVTDVKDAFIPIRRMFNWVGNSIVQTNWQRLDFPLNRRQIDTIVDSVNIWLNGLTAKQYILGGRVEFNEAENPITNLMDGIIRLHLYITLPSPNRVIDFVLEYDVNYLSTLFK